MREYLHTIGLHSLSENIERTPHAIVPRSFSSVSERNFSSKKIDELYCYQVPKLGPGGSCSTSKQPEEQLFNLATAYGIEYSVDTLHNHLATERLWRLNMVIEGLQKSTGVDWLGIYRKIKKNDGQVVLLKEAYYGAFSRAEFPLTEEFAKGSNNSTVGLTGKAVLVQDVTAYNGPYYQCDAQVQSELCVPILTPENDIVGIIDAESFTPNFFSDQKIVDIVEVCKDLGREQDFISF